MKTIEYKRKLLILFSLFIMIISLISPSATSLAMSYQDAEQEFEEKSNKFLEDAEEAKDIIKILDKDAKENPSPDRNSINHIMKRLFYPGVYVNNVEDGIVAKELEKDKEDILYQGKYACDPRTPVNLINHNCNIPNFTTGLIQNLIDPYTPPTANAEKTSAYSVFGLGVPSGIPGGIVPEDPNHRSHTYTAMELFGYDLKLTSYNGEWDNITVSNSARMLSNFGVIDRISLVGTGLWNSVSTGIATFVENFSFNPVRWYRNIGKSFESAAAAGINTIIDTSELNVVATNAWKRQRFDGTLYNIYVLTDAEILRETSLNYFAIFSDLFNKKTNGDAWLQEVVELNPNIALSKYPFVYNPYWETDESIAAREAAEAQRAADIAHNEAESLRASYSDEPYSPNYVSLTPIPEPVYYTESEQLGFWYERPEVRPIIDSAIENRLLKKTPPQYGTYNELVTEWQTKYQPFFESNFDAYGESVTDILEKSDAEVFLEYPHLDPKQSISRYACANEDGTLMRASNGTVEYLYLKNNTPGNEYLNPKCKEAREPIGGGYFGNGETDPTITDTRHISNINEDGLGVSNSISNSISSGILSINSFLARTTNVVLDLAYSPILEKLGISKIIEGIISGFRDTVFFPLVILAAAIGAIMFFFQALKSGSIMRVVSSIAITILIFIVGAGILLNPGTTVAFVDKLPATLDRIVSNAILNDDDGSNYCTTGETEDGIRSAQCNVWGAMVFEPWVELQFGTSYENLYANGYGNGSSFSNTNSSLVGDAAVNMGGGVIENNWAMYQLSVTKAGTINSKPALSPVGMVDKNFYRIVDAQAGPDNGAGRETRYFDAWSGKERSSGSAFLTLAQSVTLSLAIVLLAFAKIEVTLVFAITFLAFPAFLLFALLPKGQIKLMGYLSNLISLLLRSILIAVMLSVLLKIITLSYQNIENFKVGAMMGIFISVAFIIYRKEILDLVSSNSKGQGIIGSDINKMKEAAINAIPNDIKQVYRTTKAKVKGSVSGSLGGAIGAIEHESKIRRERSSIQKQIRDIDKILETEGENNIGLIERKQALEKEEEEIELAMANKKRLSKERAAAIVSETRELEIKIQENEIEIKKLIIEGKKKNQEKIASLIEENYEYEEEKRKLEIEYAGGIRESKGVIAQALRGSAHSRNVIGRTAERKILREGFSGFGSYRDSRDHIIMQGAEDISESKNPMEGDVYKEILSNTEANKGSNPSMIGSEIGQLTNPKVQKKVREIAEERRKMASDPSTRTALKPDSNDMQKAAKIVDKRRKMEKIQKTITNPMTALAVNSEDKIKRKQFNISDVASIIEEIEKDLDKGTIGSVKVDSEGTIVVKDISRRIVKPKIEDEGYSKKLEELARKSSYVQEQLEKKLEEERKSIELNRINSDNENEEEKK